MTVLIVVPARGCSVRVPRKNLADLGGKPLIAWTIGAARAAGRYPYVSTEDAEIADVARIHGARVIDRPAHLATSDSTTEAVLLHALDAVTGLDPDGPTTHSHPPGRELTYEPTIDMVMTLQPTSPLLSVGAVQRFLKYATAGFAEDCLFSVTEDRGDFWRVSPGTHTWSRIDPDAPRTRAARTPLWEENSAVYLTKVSALRETGSILGRSARGIPIPADEAFDVNTEWDLEIVRAVIAARRNRT